MKKANNSETAGAPTPTVSETENMTGAKLSESEKTLDKKRLEIKGELAGSKHTSNIGGRI
jgi:hypothetical protein